jgi:hypothetical protein
VEIPEGADREAAMGKVRAKWFDAHIAPRVAEAKEGEGVAGGGGGMEERMMEDQEAMRVMDQGLRLMWKLGVMEAEEIAREVCRQVCDPKSEAGDKARPSKELLKRRVLAVHHIGEKYKAVAARLKKEEKRGFSVQDFLDQAAADKTAPDGETPHDNNAPLNPQPSTPVDDAPAAAPASMNID